MDGHPWSHHSHDSGEGSRNSITMMYVPFHSEDTRSRFGQGLLCLTFCREFLQCCLKARLLPDVCMRNFASIRPTLSTKMDFAPQNYTFSSEISWRRAVKQNSLDSTDQRCKGSRYCNCNRLPSSKPLFVEHEATWFTKVSADHFAAGWV